MRVAVAVVLVALIASVAVADKKKEDKKDDITKGFREDINWVKYEQAVSIAKDLNKPIFFLIHKTWCGACKNLKREFKSAARILDLLNLSDKFVMVNVEDDEEPQDDKFAPDGGYIPRILFLDTDGNPMKTNNEKRYKNNKYFYPLVPQIIDAMERALVEFKELGGVEEEPKEKIEKKEEKKKDEKVKEEKKKEEKKEEKKKEEKKKEEKKNEKKKEEKKDEKKKGENKKEEKKKDDKKKQEKKEDKKKDDKKKDKKDKKHEL